MPEISLVVMLAVAVVSAIVIFKVAKGMIQGVLLASAVVSILVAVAGGIVVKDALELKDNFQKGDNLLLLSDDSWARLTAGIVVKGQAAGSAEPGQGSQTADGKADGEAGSAEAVTAAELEKLSPLFAKKDYATMRGKNYKLIIIKESSVTGLLPEKPAGGSTEERAAMLAALLGLKISQNPAFIISEYKEGNAVVYPETPVFKAIKLVPLSFFRNAAEKALRQASGVGKDVAAKAVAAASAAAVET